MDTDLLCCHVGAACLGVPKQRSAAKITTGLKKPEFVGGGENLKMRIHFSMPPPPKKEERRERAPTPQNDQLTPMCERMEVFSALAG